MIKEESDRLVLCEFPQNTREQSVQTLGGKHMYLNWSNILTGGCEFFLRNYFKIFGVESEDIIKMNLTVSYAGGQLCFISYHTFPLFFFFTYVYICSYRKLILMGYFYF